MTNDGHQNEPSLFWDFKIIFGSSFQFGFVTVLKSFTKSSNVRASFQTAVKLAKLVMWGFPGCFPTRILFPPPLNSCNISRCERPTAEPVQSNLPIVRCAPLHAQSHTVYVDMHIWLSAIVPLSDVLFAIV